MYIGKFIWHQWIEILSGYEKELIALISSQQSITQVTWKQINLGVLLSQMITQLCITYHPINNPIVY